MNLIKYFEKANKHYQKFGIEGLKYLYNLRQKKHQILEINLEGLKTPVILRNNTTDIPTFNHVF
jgi:hypothetical protein